MRKQTLKDFMFNNGFASSINNCKLYLYSNVMEAYIPKTASELMGKFDKLEVVDTWEKDSIIHVYLKEIKNGAHQTKRFN